MQTTLVISSIAATAFGEAAVKLKVSTQRHSVLESVAQAPWCTSQAQIMHLKQPGMHMAGSHWRNFWRLGQQSPAQAPSSEPWSSLDSAAGDGRSCFAGSSYTGTAAMHDVSTFS